MKFRKFPDNAGIRADAACKAYGFPEKAGNQSHAAGRGDGFRKGQFAGVISGFAAVAVGDAEIVRHEAAAFIIIRSFPEMCHKSNGKGYERFVNILFGENGDNWTEICYTEKILGGVN